MDKNAKFEYAIVTEEEGSAYRLSELKGDDADWNGDDPFMNVVCTCASEVASVSPAIGVIRDRATQKPVGWVYANAVDWGVLFFESKKELLAAVAKYGCRFR